MSKFYAVKKGRQPGIYRSWEECKTMVNGFSGALYKSFLTLKEAEEYLGVDGSNIEVKEDIGVSSNITSSIIVYTDGACSNNGQRGAKAGIGVYFSDDDPRNLSEQLPGEKQTNQRAELYAAIRALEVSDPKSSLEIRTDSSYLVKGMTEWLPKWLSLRVSKVSNLDLFQRLSELSQGRQIRWVKVKGHSGEQGNEAADRLAVAGI